MLGIHRYEYTPILGWSVSRYDTFSLCKRQYYYQYYAKHDPDYPRARIEALKKLTSIPLEIGSSVHDTIAAILRRLLRSDESIDVERFRHFVQTKVAHACQSKKFFEVYYAQTDAVMPEDMLPSIMDCLREFFDSTRFEWIKNKAIENKEEWLIDPPGFGESRLDDMKVYCKVDFLFAIDGRAVIIDWKTGKRDDQKHGKQLLGYSVWAMHHLGVQPSNIDAVIAYLRPEYQETQMTPTAEGLDDFTAQIRRETKEMYAFCTNVDENLPLSKRAFEMTSNQTFCEFCNFRELCNRI